jgi:hypothetical protein
MSKKHLSFMAGVNVTILKNAFGDFDSKCGKNKYFYIKKVANSEKKTAENSVLNIGPPVLTCRNKINVLFDSKCRKKYFYFKKVANSFREKTVKIAENSVHNIGPRS